MNDWKDITIEKPPVDINVMCYCNIFDEDIFFIGYFCKYQHEVTDSNSGVVFNKTSHWKYLENPKGEIIKK